MKKRYLITISILVLFLTACSNKNESQNSQAKSLTEYIENHRRESRICKGMNVMAYLLF